MNLIRCDICNDFYELEDVLTVENKQVCYCCQKTCQHCGRAYDYGSDTYCYWCMEGDLV